MGAAWCTEWESACWSGNFKLAALCLIEFLVFHAAATYHCWKSREAEASLQNTARTIGSELLADFEMI